MTVSAGRCWSTSAAAKSKACRWPGPTSRCSCWPATAGCGIFVPNNTEQFPQNELTISAATRPPRFGPAWNANWANKLASHRHRALPGSASAGQRGLGSAIRGAVSLDASTTSACAACGFTSPSFRSWRSCGASARTLCINRPARGSPARAGVLGFYSPTSNRVTLYDQGAGASNRRAWQQNEATIIHEATHQMAFNTGVHNRFAPTPRWLAEGLGTMFEAPGVWDWRNHNQLSERINRGRLGRVSPMASTWPTGRRVRQPVGFRPTVREQSVGRLCRGLGLGIVSHRNLSRRSLASTCKSVANRPNFEAYPLGPPHVGFHVRFWRRLAAAWKSTSWRSSTSCPEPVALRSASSSLRLTQQAALAWMPLLARLQNATKAFFNGLLPSAGIVIGYGRVR